MTELNIKYILPLSPLQEGIFFHTLGKEKEDDAYFEQVAFNVGKKLDVGILVSCLQHLVDRHDTLRTNFVVKEGHRLLQVVFDNKKVEYSIIDFSKESNTEVQLDKLLKDDRHPGFDLANDALFRPMIVKLATGYKIICSNHHIILDGWSRSLLMNELFEIYDQLSNDALILDLPAPVSFRNYILWLQTQSMQAADLYWKEYLQDFKVEVKLPYRNEQESTEPKFEVQRHKLEATARIKYPSGEAACC